MIVFITTEILMAAHDSLDHYQMHQVPAQNEIIQCKLGGDLVELRVSQVYHQLHLDHAPENQHMATVLVEPLPGYEEVVARREYDVLDNGVAAQATRAFNRATYGTEDEPEGEQ